MTARTPSQYPIKNILERWRLITLDDLSSCYTIGHGEISTITNAVTCAAANHHTAHLVTWRDGIVAYIVSTRAKTFGELSASTIIAAYRNAVAGGGVYREIGSCSDA
jgi:hypothetical protein